MRSLKEIAGLFADRLQDDFERKITPYWIGQMVRRKLGLRTEKKHGNYVIVPSEGTKLTRLYERFGVLSDTGDLGDSGDSQTDAEGGTTLAEAALSEQ